MVVIEEKQWLTGVAKLDDPRAIQLAAYLPPNFVVSRSLAKTLATGQAWFWSRSKGRLWKKGESSGNVLRVIEARIDCDQDALWLKVEAAGPACHTGERSCFFRRIEDGKLVRDA